ncbi:MAG: peptidylprolyl isomerase [Sulfurospirillaceae bacterium]|nr:peptidylprolyl isomerase [Sulfurospirillaceae bacterium]MDD3463120.1 peptidylprolyl isomerase [Sulfurospirillaceae bacterium]
MGIGENKVVSISYELKDVQSGDVLDSNLEAAPLSFIVGKGQIIPGLEEEIKKLSAGDSSEIKVLAKDAYGEYDQNALQTLPREQFAGLELEVGMTLYGQGENGETVQVLVKSFSDEIVEIDFNHPLAGKDLLFSVEILEVRDATANEIMNGYVGDVSSGCGCGSNSGGSCHITDDDFENGSCCGNDNGHSNGGGCCGTR